MSWIEKGLYVICVMVIAYIIYMYVSGSDLQLKCVVSTVDGNKYCVRDRKQVKKAANILAKVTKKLEKLVEYMKKEEPEHKITKNLASKFNPNRIMETLPTSKLTAYSENKGEKVAFCLNKNVKESSDDELIDEHTLMFVAIHELTHIGTDSIGHKKDFWENFKYMLEKAKEAGIHDPMDYKEKPAQYCGMTIRDNPYYDT